MTQKPSDVPPALQDPTIAHNARLGLVMFFIYFLFYAGFVALATFKYEWLQHSVLGLNLAILYGMGLIVIAIIMALIYMLLCRMPAADRPAGTPRH
jgi:uncharacterized membrane protein (DUF485 family)